ncbi:uncharacterized protein N7511_002640 [Penicillium nucicola]|uniref:uncharacterized protein n=1 Tax=Penicillium nucicola TaxID=1850975 RepID=UPI00254552F7|nr:uncharacterized protein N7511_002640 [Penicillium nucicola]KAJ5770589.1 hypothetical protein N7511_002640 [Penicillium nucicola]
MVFAWLRGFFTSTSTPTAIKEDQPQSSRQARSRSHRRSQSKKVRDRERELRRNWTGQKGDWNRVTAEKGPVVGGVC